MQTEQLQNLNQVAKYEEYQEGARLGYGVTSQRDSQHDAFMPMRHVIRAENRTSALVRGEVTAFTSAGSDSSFGFTGVNDPLVEDEVYKIIRYDSDNPSKRVKRPSLALMSPVQAPSPLFEFYAPAFTEFSQQTNRRALMDHFCNVLSHLIVLREETGNPFQQLVLPLSQNSQAVTSAMFALASAHLECRGVQNSEKSVYFYNQAIQGLVKLIGQGGNVHKNELLAAIMLLVYYEVVSPDSYYYYWRMLLTGCSLSKKTD